MKRIRQMPFLAWFHASPNIVKYSRDANPAVWLEDFRLAYQAGGVDDDLFIIQYLPLYLAKSARAWLEHLPTNSIHSWAYLKRILYRVWDLRVPWEFLGSQSLQAKGGRNFT